MAGYCGCLWWDKNHLKPTYLPQVSLKAHATVLSSAVRTTLTQTFINPSNKAIKEVSYQFPLYDGVSVVGFECKVGSRILHSKVKTKSQANVDYQNAVARRQTAAIVDHTSESDLFLIRLGNVPANEKINVDITFVGELRQDSQTDGIRYTLPNSIAPRYGDHLYSKSTQFSSLGVSANLQGISITVDVQMEKGSILRELESPSHRVRVSLGRIASTPAAAPFEPSQASVSMIAPVNKDLVVLEQDFIILIKADGLDTPCALLETHPTIPNQRALMATIVPKFSLQPASPEVVFVIDRSGSMENKIATLQNALRVFLKSLPVGVYFNICSFGSSYSFLWPTSKIYNATSLQQALRFVDIVYANMGGTEMEQAIVATVGNRLHDRDLEVLVLTDGEIYNQQSLFNFVRGKAADNTARFFSLGIGNQASHSLVEGIARAGNGFSQSAMEHEELDRKIVRMLKGALTPHVYDYNLEIEYDTQTDNDFEVLSDTEVSSPPETGREDEDRNNDISIENKPLEPISLYDEDFQEPDLNVDAEKERTAELPTLTFPKAIQAPYKIPTLYPFIRTNVFLLMDSASTESIPKALKLSATSKQGPLQLRIPISGIGTGQTIHQLASRKAMIELEEEHGWLSDSKDEKGDSFRQLHINIQQRLAERECQKLGIQFQVTGKYCSFVALEHSSLHSKGKGRKNTANEHAVEQVPGGPRVPGSGPTHITRFSSAPAHHQFCQTGNPVMIGAASLQMSGQYMNQCPSPSVSGRASLSHVLTCADMTGPDPPYDPSYQSAYIAPNVAPGPVFPSFTLFNATLNQVPAQTESISTNQSIPAAVKLGATSASTEASPFPLTQQHGVYEILQLQTFEGSWMWSNALFLNLQADKTVIADKIDILCKSAGGGFDDDLLLTGDEGTVLATLLVMGWLENRNADSRNIWELVFAKANQWVNQKLEELQRQGPDGAAIALMRQQIMDLI